MSDRTVPPPAADEHAAIAVARQAATTLVRSLARAATETRGWANEEQAFPRVERAVQDCLATLVATGVSGEAIRVPSHAFWQASHEIVQLGRLQTRARFKPRGYAGDFELLEWIVNHSLCDHPLGRLFDRYFQQQQAPQAVRHRTEFVAEAVVEHCRRSGDAECRVASIGSGPAIDIRRAAARLSSNQLDALSVVLIDIDPDALEHARRALEAYLSPARLTNCRENLFRLPKRLARASAWDAADLVCCTGLFDYLNDRDATELLAALWQWLRPGGTLVVFNFSPANPTRAYMEWIGDWFLTYRDRTQMHDLARRAGLPDESYQVGAEPLGIDLFLRATKPDSVVVRRLVE